MWRFERLSLLTRIAWHWLALDELAYICGQHSGIVFRSHGARLSQCQAARIFEAQIAVWHQGGDGHLNGEVATIVLKFPLSPITPGWNRDKAP